MEESEEDATARKGVTCWTLLHLVVGPAGSVEVEPKQVLTTLSLDVKPQRVYMLKEKTRYSKR